MIESVQKTSNSSCVNFIIYQPGDSHVCVVKYNITASTESGMQTFGIFKENSNTTHTEVCTDLCRYDCTLSIFTLYVNGSMNGPFNIILLRSSVQGKLSYVVIFRE